MHHVNAIRPKMRTIAPLKFVDAMGPYIELPGLFSGSPLYCTS